MEVQRPGVPTKGKKAKAAVAAAAAASTSGVQNQLSVARTNDDSIVSKRSTARAGYLRDTFLGCFVKKPAKRSALINRGYFIRCHAVRAELRSFVRLHGGRCQIVSLGAGFDTSFFTLAAEGVTAQHFFEVDFASVVANKRLIVRYTPELCQMLRDPVFVDGGADESGGGDLLSATYSLLACDLCRVGDLRNRLVAAKLDVTLPTLVLAECVLTYMAPQDSDRVIYWVRTQLPNATFMCYEQIKPDDAFGRVMRANLDVRGSSLLGVATYPDAAAEERRFRALGYANVSVQTIWGLWQRLEPAERLRVENMEEFDEHEEWAEKCAHYVVVMASPDAAMLRPSDVPPTNDASGAMVAAECWTRVEQFAGSGRIADTRVWGHTALAAGARIIVFGGYGGSHRHERSNAVVAIDCTGAAHNAVVLGTRGIVPAPRVLHAAAMLRDGRMIVHGGRASPAAALGDVYVATLVAGNAVEWNALEVVGNAAPARYRHSLTLVDADHGSEWLFGFGGKSSWRTDCFCGDAWLLNVGARSCTAVSFAGGVAPCARASHSAVWFRGALYLYGGFNASGALADLWRITVDTARAQATATLLSSAMPPRYSHSGVAMRDDAMLFVGGLDAHLQNNVVRVRVAGAAGDASVTVDVVSSGLPELYSRQRSVLMGNRIYIVGGGQTCFSFGSIFADKLTALTFGDEYVAPPVDVAAASAAQSDRHATAAAPSRGGAAAVGGMRVPIPRMEHASAEQFRDWVQRVREPCLFSGRGAELPQWSAADIAAAVGPDTPASIHVCSGPLLDFSNKNFQFEVVPFATMLSRVEDPAEHLYFRSLGANARKDPSSISETFPRLAEQFLVPAFARDLVTPDRIHSSCLRFSSADVQMWTHYDINDNLLCGLKGRKRLLLFHPEEVRHLYAEGTASQVLDVDAPDLQRFPRFAKAVAWEGVLEPGDVLYIPAMWWHNVRTLTPCYGLNVFFRHLPAPQYQPSDLYGNRDPVAAARAAKSVAAALEQLAQLPDAYRRFFTRKLILDMKQTL